MQKIEDFLRKHFQGGYAMPFFKWYIHFPKLAPLMIVAITSIAFGEIKEVWWVYVIGWMLFCLGVFIFFLPVKK